MEKTISALDARKRLGQVLEEVFYQGHQYVVERAGKPMAVVIPVEQYMQWKEKRARFFAMVDEARARTSDVPPAEIHADVEEAVRATRASPATRR